MRAADFVEPSTGTLEPTPDGALAFNPAPLPPNLALTDDVVVALSHADRAIGRLDGVGRTLGEHANAYLLINPFLRREAVLSSRIEGTEATVADVFLFPVAPARAQHSDAREVYNYVRAHEYGLQSELPICLRLIREMHAILMRGVRGEDKHPGEFRRRQNWIGTPGSSIADAKFVPPPPANVEAHLGLLERYINDRSESTPPLVRLALVHYQFETVHPFIDGNGRIGRMLVSLMLCKEHLLPLPLLYLSEFFDSHKDEYAARLFAVSARGDWRGWLTFFLRGVAEQARDAVQRAERMFNLRAEWARRVQTARSSALLVKLVDHLFVAPVLDSTRVMEVLHVSRPAALSNLEKLASCNIVQRIEGETKHVYVAHEVMRLAEPTRR